MKTQAQFLTPSKTLLLALCCGVGSTAFADTMISVGGYVKTDYNISRYSRGTMSGFHDFTFGPEVAVAGTGARSTAFHAKETRLWVSSATGTCMGDLNTQVSVDFLTVPGDFAPLNASHGALDTVDNGYRPRLRTAYGQWAGWTIGQNYSTFMDMGAMPELGEYGVPVGTIYMMQPMVRYTFPLYTGQADVALENPDSTIKNFGAADDGATALVGDGRKMFPDVIGRYSHEGDGWRGTARLMFRELTAGSAADGALRNHKWTTSMGVGANVDVMGSDNLMVQAHWGTLGRYMGFGVFRDGAVSVAAAPGLGLGSRLSRKESGGGLVAYTHRWQEDLRSSLVYSVARADVSSNESATASDKRFASWHLNLLWNPVHDLRLGAEYSHVHRKQNGGTHGNQDRLGLTAKWDFV